MGAKRPEAVAWLLVLLLVGCAAPAERPAPAAAGGASAPAAASPATSTAATATPAPRVLRVSTSGITGNSLIPWAPFEAGLFAKYGLQIDELPDIASSTTAVQSLLSRDLDIISIAPNAAIEATAKGAPPLVTIATPPPGTGFWLYAAPGISSVEDLRGKLIGANQPGSSTYFAVTYALREHGLQVGRDYQVLSVGNQQAQLASLQQGQTQAAVFSVPGTVLARRAGMVELKDLNDIPYNGYGVVVRREMLDDPAGREVLLRYLQACVEGIARLRQDRAFADAVIRKYLKTDDPEVVDEVYRAFLPKRVPYVVPEGIALVLQGIAERDPSVPADLSPEQFYDNSLVAELERSGFIDALYR
ncbi:MAG: ABC transporter substrate-binding protein [Chloroflexi bacterium]|nr:ABC transporter substrate-binding protein [Chloroflexota bacterium]